MITDVANGKTDGASFDTVAANTNFSAILMRDDDPNLLTPQFDAGESVLAGWNFTTTLTGNVVLLSFDISLGAKNLHLRLLSNGQFSAFTSNILTYNDSGIVSFDVSSFSGYAVTGTAVPGLATLGLGIVWGCCISNVHDHNARRYVSAERSRFACYSFSTGIFIGYRGWSVVRFNLSHHRLGIY